VEVLNNVFMIAATNRPDIIDPAVLRPGRLGLHLYVPVPTEDDRYDILSTIAKKLPLAKDINLKELSKHKRLENFTGADLSHLCENAAKIAAWDDARLSQVIDTGDFEKALDTTTCSISKDDLKYYRELNPRSLDVVPSITNNTSKSN
jgi:SpoVK/Ycf46/Vps4 family AAA+-type ATPase